MSSSAKTYRAGDTVACDKCGRHVTIKAPSSRGGILLATPRQMREFAFRCQVCDFITCNDCAVRTYEELHEPGGGIVTCPSCKKVAGPMFFTEWLEQKGGTLAGASSQAPGKGCFIATAAYGSTLGPEIQFLRRYRDERLTQRASGRAFISLYNLIGPPLAKLVQQSPACRHITRVMIGFLCRILKRSLRPACKKS